MRVGILADSFIRGARIYEEIAALSYIEPYLVLSPAEGRRLRQWLSAVYHLLLAKRKFTRFLQGCFSGRVVRLQYPLDHPETIRCIQAMELDVGLHAAGVIYREPLIKSFKLGLLNAHIGLLPNYRGRSVMEWSVLQGDPTGVTVFFIDGGIDTGKRIVFFDPVKVSGLPEQCKTSLFALDAKMYRKALEKIATPGWQPIENDLGSGKRYFPMSKLLLQVVGRLLQRPE